jgi:DnaK suppressor protein
MPDIDQATGPHPPEVIERLRLQLLQRRAALVESRWRGQREIDALKNQETGAEMEEEAQSSAATFVLTSLSDSQRREVAQIDAALDRMKAGTYGICVDCGARISEERLRVVPYAIRDAGCGSRAEADSTRELPSL